MSETAEVLEFEVEQDSLPQPVGWTILIEPIKVKEKSDGGIILPEEAKNAEEHLRYIGRVVSMGHLCYRHEKFQHHPKEEAIPWCKIGDYVSHGQYTGQTVTVKTKHGLEKYKLLHDDEILAVIPNPAKIIAYL